MQRREFLKLTMSTSALMLMNSCYMRSDLVFPFGEKSEKYKKNYFDKLDDFVENNSEYFERYFDQLDNYCDNYSKASKNYRKKHENELKNSLKPLIMAMEYVSRENLSDRSIHLLHGNSNMLLNKVMSRILKNNSGCYLLNKVFLKTDYISLNLVFHEFGHSFDKNMFSFSYFTNKKEEVRCEMVAEHAELYMGYNIAKIWNKKIGKEILDQTKVSPLSLKRNRDIKTRIKIDDVYENARLFNLVLLNELNMDIKKTWDFLINSNRNKVFKKLKNGEKKGLTKVIKSSQKKLDEILKKL